MNYLAHSLRFLNRPYFVAGVCAPDWLSVADRAVRLRSRTVAPKLAQAAGPDRDFYEGVLQHLHDDDWFHSTRGFAEVTGELALLFRQAIGAEHATPCSFLGHVVMEMLLDAVLIDRHPRLLDDYYGALALVDPSRIQNAVNQCARQPTDRLATLIPRFIEERFLDDYQTDRGLAHRLNQVLARVRLAALDQSAVAAIAAGRNLVHARADDLLPSERFVI
jgi:hypothetical protein